MIKPGQLCRIDSDLCGSYNGEIVEYTGRTPFTGAYSFKTANQVVITLHDDSYFIVLPSIDELRDLIDLTLSLGDKEWFKELVQQMNFIKGYQSAKGLVR